MTARNPLIRERHGHAILESYHQNLAIPLPGPVEPQDASAFSHKHASWSPRHLRVGIIGAGASGLYTAMILRDLGIQYEILEANKIVGGRLFTHHFGEKPNDYYAS
jgi:NAD(P)-binding Rossmann-like domain